jgi:hypothetical protein
MVGKKIHIHSPGSKEWKGNGSKSTWGSGDVRGRIAMRERRRKKKVSREKPRLT